MGEIVYGSSNFHYAKITRENDVVKFDKPIPIEGMKGFSMEVEQSNKKVFADNVVKCVIPGGKTRSATASFLKISQDYAEVIGYKRNSNGMITDTGTRDAHAIMFEEDIYSCETKEVTKRLHILYHVTAGEPSIESSTIEDDEIEEQTIEFEYEAIASSIAKDDDGKSVQYAYFDRTLENIELYDQWTQRVLLPNEKSETTDHVPTEETEKGE